MDFQPCTLTTPDLGYVAYCYVADLLDLPHLIILPSHVPPPSPSSFACLRHRHCHRHCHRHHRITPSLVIPPSPSQHTKKRLPLFFHPSLPDTDPPLLPLPCHTCRDFHVVYSMLYLCVIFSFYIFVLYFVYCIFVL